jgi:hypothetical protein
LRSLSEEDFVWKMRPNLRITHAKHFHGSLRYSEQRPVLAGADAEPEESTRIRGTVQGKDIRTLIDALRHGCVPARLGRNPGTEETAGSL